MFTVTFLPHDTSPWPKCAIVSVCMWTPAQHIPPHLPFDLVCVHKSFKHTGVVKNARQNESSEVGGKSEWTQSGTTENVALSHSSSILCLHLCANILSSKSLHPLRKSLITTITNAMLWALLTYHVWFLFIMVSNLHALLTSMECKETHCFHFRQALFSTKHLFITV